jgi:predicted ester cyclase
MSTETKSNVASAEHNRIVASRWIDAFNARDDGAEAAARTADYIAHAPESIQPAALDSDAWVEFLGVFVEGFPDLHLEVQDSSADEGMVAQRVLFTGTHIGPFRGLPPDQPTGALFRSGDQSDGRWEGRRALVPARRGHAVRAARPAYRPGPAVAPTAPRLAGHHAVGEAAALGSVIGTTFRVAGQSHASAESPTASRMSHRFQPAVSTGSPGTDDPGHACTIWSFPPGSCATSATPLAGSFRRTPPICDSPATRSWAPRAGS